MPTTELITPPHAPSSPEPWSDARPAASADPAFEEMADEALPLVGVMPLYGPPVVVLAVPWLLLSLMLAGPFAVLVTLVVLMVVAAALVALAGAILAAPYLLFRRFHAYREGHATMRARPARSEENARQVVLRARRRLAA